MYIEICIEPCIYGQTIFLSDFTYLSSNFSLLRFSFLKTRGLTPKGDKQIFIECLLIKVRGTI